MSRGDEARTPDGRGCLHEGLAANAKEMADMVGEVEAQREFIRQVRFQVNAAIENVHDYCAAVGGIIDAGLKLDKTRQALNPKPET